MAGEEIAPTPSTPITSGSTSWRRSILIALSAKNKIGFIDGDCKEPKPDAQDHPQWSRCNFMVTSWLLNSLSKEIGDSVIYSKFARDLWNSLEHRFGQSNGAKLYQLQKEISMLVQGNNSIAGYFTRLKKLWDELDSLNSHLVCSCECVCDGKRKVTKFLEDQRIIQFLMGLNDVYSQARGNILMMNPLPGIDFAYSLLLQDENQREIYARPQLNADASSFMVGVQGRGPQRNNNQPQQRTWTNSQKPLTQKRIIDSGASEHMCFDSNCFLSLDPLPVPVHISLPNSFQLYVTHIGRVPIQPDMILEKVPLMRRGKVFGELRGGLYLLEPSTPKIDSGFSSNSNVFSIPKGSNSILVPSEVSYSVSSSNTQDSNVLQWHVRLGHLPFSVMKNLQF
ncbi:PREDICTED: uncharacterized protein LOC109220052 [Nicotiana attenuata]|uniref:uncharacterized protein LOC109220052 n=1 Tax=Nicotiana attenuata TaxID=49451 RepID=UPI000904AC52|nr:PREDICTED: uncharacterized protein LOC109220052 [Nicotiana attenuata]